MGREEIEQQWMIKTAERLATIEKSVKYIEENLVKIPADVDSHEDRISRLEDIIGRKVAFISGAAAAFVTAVPYVYEWLRYVFFKGGAS
jgi:hypothetical protein